MLGFSSIAEFSITEIDFEEELPTENTGTRRPLYQRGSQASQSSIWRGRE